MFGSVQALLSASADKPLWEAVLDDDCQDRDVPREDSLSKMTALWQTMKQSVLDYDPTRRSPCGLSGGQGARMAALDHSICGPFIQEVISTLVTLHGQLSGPPLFNFRATGSCVWHGVHLAHHRLHRCPSSKP